jgi:hypothetical protein
MENEIKLTEEERKRYKLSVSEVEKIEDELDISFFDIINDMSESKMPRMKIIRKICDVKDIDSTDMDMADLFKEFTKIASATFLKKN